MASGGRTLIVFLGVGKIFMSDGGRILGFDLTSALVRDWDIVNREALEDTLTSFIEANRLEPSPITLVLSEPACFSRDIELKDQPKVDEEAENFLDSVPFNYLISKKYRLGQGIRVIAANRELVDAILEAFESKGFTLHAVVPAAVFPKVGVKTALDMQFVKVVNGSQEIVQNSNMVTPKSPGPESTATAPQTVITTKKASSGFLPYLIGVAVVAIIVLVVLIIIRR